MQSEIKPLKVRVGIGVRSHVNLIMTIFRFCNYFQVTHRKTGIESNVWLRLTDLIIKIIENDILTTILYDLIYMLLSHALINERTVFNVVHGLYLNLMSFQLFRKWIASELLG